MSSTKTNNNQDTTVGTPYQPAFPLTYYLNESFDNYYTFVSPSVKYGGYTNTFQIEYLYDANAFAMYTSPPVDGSLYINRWTLNYFLCFQDGGTYQVAVRTTVGGDRGNLTVTLIDQVNLTSQSSQQTMASGTLGGRYLYYTFNLTANIPYKLELNVLTTTTGNWHNITEYVTITKV